MLSSLCRYVQTSYSRDSRRRKALVWIVVLLNTAITAQVLENSVHWTTVQKRSTADLEHYRKWGVVGPVLSGVLALLVQGLFANRATKVWPLVTVYSDTPIILYPQQLFKRKASKWIFLTLITLGMVVAVAGAMTQGVLADLCTSTVSSLPLHSVSRNSCAAKARTGRLEEAAPLTIQMSSGIWLWASAMVVRIFRGSERSVEPWLMLPTFAILPGSAQHRNTLRPPAWARQELQLDNGRTLEGVDRSRDRNGILYNCTGARRRLVQASVPAVSFSSPSGMHPSQRFSPCPLSDASQIRMPT